MCTTLYFIIVCSPKTYSFFIRRNVGAIDLSCPFSENTAAHPNAQNRSLFVFFPPQYLLVQDIAISDNVTHNNNNRTKLMHHTQSQQAFDMVGKCAVCPMTVDAIEFERDREC